MHAALKEIRIKKQDEEIKALEEKARQQLEGATREVKKGREELERKLDQ